MPIAVNCECGSKLEIDEKFLGKQILCPDCQRPLPTQAPATPPPLELPDYRRVSLLALLSLVLALVGAFTIVGTIAAIVVGVFALKHIADHPTKLEGVNYARAGIAVGTFFTFLTVALLFTPTVFGLDSFLREMAFAGRIQYPASSTVAGNNDQHVRLELTRYSRWWAVYIPQNSPTASFENTDLILVDVLDDAFIACHYVNFDGGIDDADEKMKKVLEKFYRSEIVHLVGRLNGKTLDREGEIIEKKVVETGKKTKAQEIILDLRLAGVNRRFLIQYSLESRDEVNVLIGVARRNRFERMSEVFRKTFDSQIEKRD
jgi:Domain of unknown function (DUF4190)